MWEDEVQRLGAASAVKVMEALDIKRQGKVEFDAFEVNFFDLLRPSAEVTDLEETMKMKEEQESDLDCLRDLDLDDHESGPMTDKRILVGRSGAISGTDSDISDTDDDEDSFQGSVPTGVQNKLAGLDTSTTGTQHTDTPSTSRSPIGTSTDTIPLHSRTECDWSGASPKPPPPLRRQKSVCVRSDTTGCDRPHPPPLRRALTQRLAADCTDSCAESNSVTPDPPVLLRKAYSFGRSGVVSNSSTHARGDRNRKGSKSTRHDSLATAEQGRDKTPVAGSPSHTTKSCSSSSVSCYSTSSLDNKVGVISDDQGGADRHEAPFLSWMALLRKRKQQFQADNPDTNLNHILTRLHAHRSSSVLGAIQHANTHEPSSRTGTRNSRASVVLLAHSNDSNERLSELHTEPSVDPELQRRRLQSIPRVMIGSGLPYHVEADRYDLAKMLADSNDAPLDFRCATTASLRSRKRMVQAVANYNLGRFYLQALQTELEVSQRRTMVHGARGTCS